MITKRALAAAGLAVATFAGPGQAYDAPSSAPFTQPTAGGTVAGACNFLFSGPSLDPASSPFWIEGNAAYAGIELVASVELSCALRHAYTGAEYGRLTRNAPGYTSAVAGYIPVNSFGPFYICTMINVHFMNGNESNNAETFVCRPLTRVSRA